MERGYLYIIIIFIGCVCIGIGIGGFYFYKHSQPRLPINNQYNYSNGSGKLLYDQRRQKYAFCRIPSNSIILWSSIDTTQDFYTYKYSLVYIGIRSNNGKEYIVNGVIYIPSTCRPETDGGAEFYTVDSLIIHPGNEVNFPIGVDKNYHILSTPYNTSKGMNSELLKERDEFLQKHYTFLETLPACEPNVQ